MSLSGVGRGDSLARVAPAEPVVAGERRVEIRRPGLVEWYENTPAGLEQGFTLAARPAGAGPLVLELAVAGARPVLADDAILFETAGNRRLRYGKLVAVDATGRELAARLALADAQRLHIVVEDEAAVYPLVIDPLVTDEPPSVLQSDQAGASFGYSVAGAGDVNKDGYEDVIVGAIRYDGGEGDEGAAFVFHGSASGIADGTIAAAASQIESNQINAFLGWSVGGAGDVNKDGYDDVIVGARSYDNGQTDEGIALVFHGSASGVVAAGNPGNADALIESDQATAYLGWSVAGAGDVDMDGYDDVIVGAQSYDAGETNEGAAFVFHGGASGVGDGNPGDADAQIEADQSSANLGTSVAGAGDVDNDGYDDVIVGAPAYDSGETNEGAAFVFEGGASGIESGGPGQADAQLESDQASANFGASVASAGDVNGDDYDDVIVGANLYDDGSSNEGAAFVFHGSASGVADGNPMTAATEIQSDRSNAELGAGVTGAGDVDADGYDDIWVGAYKYESGGETDEGAAFLFLGSETGVADGTPETAAADLEPNIDVAWLGWSVGSADVNGDGNSDVLAGAYLWGEIEGGEGALFIVEAIPTPEASGSLAAALGALVWCARRRARRRRD